MTTTLEETPVLRPEMVVEDYRKYKLEKANSTREPSVNNRCSELGHPCTAYCFYARTVPTEQRPPITEELAIIFDEGKKQERAIQQDLLDMGYDVTRQQESLTWKKYRISGHKDFAISKNGSPYVRCEFKSVNPYTFEQLNTPEDVRNHKATWVQKWYGQTVLYMLLDEQKEYWLFLKNKSAGMPKPIVFRWTDELWQDAEALIKKAELINGLVDSGAAEVSQELKLAEPTECLRCQFFTSCVPPIGAGGSAKILTDELALELEEKAKRMFELKPMADECEELEEELKTNVKAIATSEESSVVFGNCVANIKRIPIKASTPKPKKAYTQVRVSFVRTEGAK